MKVYCAIFLFLVCAFLLSVLAGPLAAQTSPEGESTSDLGWFSGLDPDLEKRIRELEQQVAELGADRDSVLGERVEELEDQVAELEAERKKGPDDGFWTIGGKHFRLGGKADFLYIKSDGFRDPIVGDTDERDGRFLVDVLRLVPEIRVNKDVRLRGQIDFKPQSGRTVLKEMTARFRTRPVWWFRSEFKFGLDDRFIRMQRDTKNYPLAGTAFWRDETVGFFSRLRFGDKDGPPKSKSKDDGEKSRNPFDFGRNPGEVQLHLSVANIHRLDLKEVGFDDATFNELLQDDRNIFDDLSVKEIGLGIGYARNFKQLGELSVLGFYYMSDLNSDSVDVLKEDLTLRDDLGNVLAGYGDSNDDDSYRFGFSGEYFLPAKSLIGGLTKTRRNDGLRVKAQWIKGEDGEMRRESWFVQGGYRYSFPERLLFDRYFHSIEPIVRYGEFNTNISPDPNLPGTWDREMLVLGLVTRITKSIILRAEYALHDEETGGGGGTEGPGDVDNNEFAVNLIVRF